MIELERLEKMSKICSMVSSDVAADASGFDGQPFTGKTVAQYFGNHGAAIDALSTMVKELIDDKIKDAK